MPTWEQKKVMSSPVKLINSSDAPELNLFGVTKRQKMRKLRPKTEKNK